MGIQLDFGGFDPTFLGVTLRFGTRTAWQAYQSFTENAEPVSFSHLSNDLKFEALSIVSVLSHEVRHFHDFLLSAYGAHVFRIRIQSLVNLLGVIPDLLDENSNCLYLPISRWSKLDAIGRAAQLAYLPRRGDGRSWTAVPLPELSHMPSEDSLKSGSLSSEQGLDKLIQASIRLQDRLSEFTYNPRTVIRGKSFQPWQVLELSGLLTQLEEIGYTYGPAETEFFIRRLSEAGRNPYAGMLGVAFAMWDAAQGIFDNQLTGAMVCWTLLGSYQKDLWKACPTERFVRLWDLVSHEGVGPNGSHLMTLYDNWSHRLGLSRVEEGLLEARDLFIRLRQEAEDLFSISRSEYIDDYGKLLIRIVRSVQEANSHMVDCFLRDPWAYTSPSQYLLHVAEFANPVLRFCFDGFALRHSLTHDELAHKGYIVQWAEKDLLLSYIKPFEVSKYIFFDPNDVSDISTLFGLVDFLFAERARARADVQRPGRVFFRESHITPIELL